MLTRTYPTAYSVPRSDAPIDLYLDANEGPRIDAWLPDERIDPERVRRYPKQAELEEVLAARFGLAPDQVVVTAGADDALFRASLAYLGGGRDLAVAVPAFEMIPRYAYLAGAEIREVPETDGRFPTEGVLAAIDAARGRVGMAAVVSPSNPTGSVASGEDLRRVAAALAPAPVLADLAYAEFADEDLTETALALPNVIVVRTFSKAWGLAGARVGWAMGPRELVTPLRATGSPFAVAGPSLALALARLRTGERAMRAYVERVRRERVELSALLRDLGAGPRPTQANFVLADVANPKNLRDGLAARGIAVRIFPDNRRLAGAVRITCPGNAADMKRLAGALAEVLG